MSQAYYARNQSVSAGSVLARAREELELSVADVARNLKISPAQVEALEEGAYERLPGRVFVRGFLRNYAKLLGVDPQPLLKSMEYEMPQPVVVDEPPPSAEVVMPRGEKTGWPLYAGFIAVLVVGALAIYEFGYNEAPPASTTAESPAAAESAPTNAAAPLPAPAAAPAPSAPMPSAGTAQSSPLATASNSSAPPGAAGRPLDSSASASPVSTPLPQKASRPGERELHFRFEQESWVEIRDRNDKVIFSKLNRAGTEERVAAVPPLKLVVGNARAVRLNYGEQPVDLTPHIGVTVARLTLQ